MSALIIGRSVVTTLLGQQLLSKAISDASSSVYSNLSSIFSYSNSIDKLLIELDVNQRIKTMESISTEICDKNIIGKKSIKSSLEGIHLMILEIKNDLDKIKKIISEHKLKYFSSWRALDIYNESKDLKIHVSLLNSRYDLLVKTIEIVERIH
jgi:hypothetical protein